MSHRRGPSSPRPSSPAPFQPPSPGEEGEKQRRDVKDGKDPKDERQDSSNRVPLSRPLTTPLPGRGEPGWSDLAGLPLLPGRGVGRGREKRAGVMRVLARGPRR